MNDGITQIKEDFSKLNSWEDKYKEIIKYGKSLEPMEDEFKEEKFRVKGCQSQVWLHPKFEGGVVLFAADSDSMLVKGIVALLLKVYNSKTPDEILSTKAEFLKEIGITDHLSMNRTNGLAAMMKQIQLYALAYKSLGEKANV